MRPAPLVGTLVVAGVGLIGGSVALGARQRFLAERVIGLDRDPAVLDAARGLGAIDEAQLAPGPWLADADLVVLATPGHALVPTGLALKEHLREDAVVTDVGGVKAPVVAGLRELRFVGGHPMAGSERGGVLHAEAALLENAVWVLTPEAGTDPAALERVRGLVAALGARPIEVAPAQHDRLVATVSHLPYLASVALTALVAEGEESGLKMLLAAGGFRDLTRVASGDPLMSRDMVAGNRAAVKQALAGYRAQLERLERLLDDPEALLAAGERARLTRDSIPIVRRGLLPARFEVVIAVPDRPGELARITHALGEAGVNVKDIEVLGVREAGGAIRLAFEDADEQERGTAALRAAGYEARGRNNGAVGR
ncbi:MAG: prephenate dehydrogenase [Deinococcales bacterium]|nr:prephenate dehydrogenase [Deinococcales bacterium]